MEIKWPNDVLLDGLKTSGILMELSAEATRVDFLVLGIGVNLNVERDGFPEEFRTLATSLVSHSGRSVDRAHFTRRLFVTLEDVLDLHADGVGGPVPPLPGVLPHVGSAHPRLGSGSGRDQRRVPGNPPGRCTLPEARRRRADPGPRR